MKNLAAMTLPCLLLGTALVATPAAGHAGHDHGPEGYDAHKHHRPSKPPTKEQLEKRRQKIIQREVQRKKTRAQRAKDRRRALGKRLSRRLGGKAISDEVRAELRAHARRVALLRRIRVVAATKADDDTVQQVDRLLARENARHEHWWRAFHDRSRREGRKPDGGKDGP